MCLFFFIFLVCGRVPVGIVAKQRENAVGGVLATSCVVIERNHPDCGVVNAGCVVYERIVTQECVG